MQAVPSVAVRLERLDFAPLSGKRIGETGDVGADSELMSAMPVARCGDHLSDGLEAATALVETLEIISGGAVDEEDVGAACLAG